MKRAIITVDLGFGDSGKGACVDWLCRQEKVDCVVRYSGGHQAAHNVVLPDGRHHTFSQYGSGSFSGCQTYIGEDVIIDPVAMRVEKEHLARTMGQDPPPHAVNPRCLVTTSYHRIINRAEFAETRLRIDRGESSGSSCGVGIGETRSYWIKHGSDSIFDGDSSYPDVLYSKLRLMRQRYLSEFPRHAELIEKVNLLREVEQLSYQDDRRAVYLGSANTVVFEASQGVLIDETWGKYPHNTWSTVTSRNAEEMVSTSGVIDVKRYGLIRSYFCRHGSGPLPSEVSEAFSDEPHNAPGTYQGQMRYGWMDIYLLNYAIKHCGSKLDGLIVSHLDQVRGDFKVIMPTKLPYKDDHWSYNRVLGGESRTVDRGSLLKILEEYTGVPVVAVADGPTHENRRWV